ncbi:MAG: Rpn family recombination-promoting nuclease/putative transposase, partial [Bacteroidota bacterium]
FSDPEKVKSFLQGALPAKLAANLEYTSLEIDPNNYVDQHLQEYFADVVYTCRYSSRSHLQLAFLFEHKSYVPKRPHLQLLRYILNIWEQREKEGLPLLPVVPMIIYHGREKWKIKKLTQYFDGTIPLELEPFIPSFEYLLTNLQEESSFSIRQRFHLLTLQMGFLLMKDVRDKKLIDKLEEILRGMEILHPTEQGRIYLEQVFVYLLTATKLDKEKVMDKARNISQEAGEFANTAGMQLIKMGLKKGIQQGRIEGMKNALYLHASKMLLKKMDISLIGEILELPIKEVLALQKKLKEEGKL